MVYTIFEILRTLVGCPVHVQLAIVVSCIALDVLTELASVPGCKGLIVMACIGVLLIAINVFSDTFNDEDD